MGSFIKRLEICIWVLVGIVILSAFICITIYMNAHTTTLSGSSSEWASFGSYIGGVLSPIIYFVTLLAIIGTMLLQKELLISQNNDAKNQYELQQRQLDLATEEFRKNSMLEFKRTCLNILDQQLRHQQYILQQTRDTLFLLIDHKAKGTGINMEQFDANVKLKERTEQTISVLTIATLGFSLEQFTSTEQMQKKLENILMKI